MPEFETVLLEDNLAERFSSRQTGDRGEALAADFLAELGYRIVISNFTIPVGRDVRGGLVVGEIDLVALEGTTLCFVEVKTRTSDAYAGPLANLDLRKQRAVTRTAGAYKRAFGVVNMPSRFDVVTVIDDGQETPRLELFKGFWTEAKFKKRRWSYEDY